MRTRGACRTPSRPGASGAGWTAPWTSSPCSSASTTWPPVRPPQSAVRPGGAASVASMRARHCADGQSARLRQCCGAGMAYLHSAGIVHGCAPLCPLLLSARLAPSLPCWRGENGCVCAVRACCGALQLRLATCRARCAQGPEGRQRAAAVTDDRQPRLHLQGAQPPAWGFSLRSLTVARTVPHACSRQAEAGRACADLRLWPVSDPGGRHAGARQRDVPRDGQLDAAGAGAELGASVPGVCFVRA
jgi:hypothetical protein